MKKILYVFIGIIGLWILLFAVDAMLCATNHRPMFSWKQEQFTDGENHITEYYSLGYKVIESNKGWLKDYKMAFITTPIIQSNFVILEPKETCKGTPYYFYEDANFKYYFRCNKQVTLRFKNDKRETLEQALQNKDVSIRDLEEAGLAFSRENKILFTFEVKKDATCSYLEGSQTKLQKMNNDVSYYCITQANIYVNRNYYNFADAYQKEIHLENILYEMKKERVYDSGAVMYGTSNYRILVCSNNHIILGPSEMENFDIFCN